MRDTLVSEFFEERSRRRQEMARRVGRAVFAVAALLAVLFLVWIGTRAVLHFTGWGAQTTTTVSAQGYSTTRTPISILP